ncbi:hypothetical protein ACJX0J_036966 [Zea mays]
MRNRASSCLLASLVSIERAILVKLLVENNSEDTNGENVNGQLGFFRGHIIRTTPKGLFGWNARAKLSCLIFILFHPKNNFRTNRKNKATRFNIKVYFYTGSGQISK